MKSRNRYIILLKELTNPPKYNIQPQDYNIEQQITNCPKSQWLIEFEALVKLKEVEKKTPKWWQFWK